MAKFPLAFLIFTAICSVSNQTSYWLQIWNETPLHGSLFQSVYTPLKFIDPLFIFETNILDARSAYSTAQNKSAHCSTNTATHTTFSYFMLNSDNQLIGSFELNAVLCSKQSTFTFGTKYQKTQFSELPFIVNPYIYTANVEEEDCQLLPTEDFTKFSKSGFIDPKEKICIRLIIDFPRGKDLLEGTTDYYEYETALKIKECFYQNPEEFDQTLVKNGFSDDFNSLGVFKSIISQNASISEWIQPIIDDNQLANLLSGQKLAAVSCESKAVKYAFFCKNLMEKDGHKVCVPTFLNPLYGSALYTTVAVLLNSEYCIKFGTGPMTCATNLKTFGGTNCKTAYKGYAWLGEPHLCYN